MADRHDKVASLIREIAATYIQHEANTNPLITVTRVAIAPDYRRATVFVTTIPESKEADALTFLRRNGTELHRQIMKTANLKVIPHLDFEIDYGERHRQRIDEVARELDDTKAG